MAKYPIISFRGGTSDESDKGIAGSFKHGHGLDIHSRDDVLKCASTIVDIANTSGLIQFFVSAKDGSTYGFCDNGSVYAIAGSPSDPEVTYVYNDENGKIRGAMEWEEEDGNNYLIWTTNTSIARVLLNGSKDVPWSGVTPDHKTTLDGAEWHTMRNAAGSAMIANRNFLAKIDFNGNFDPATLNIRPGHLIKALEERDDYVILGSDRRDASEEGHIWSWTPVANNWVEKKRIPIKGVNSLVTTELPLLQGGADGELFFADFVNSTPLATIPGGGQTYPDGTAIENDLALFGIFGGTYPGVWSYGRRGKNRPQSLNYQYRLADTVAGSSISTIGAITVANQQTLVSWGTTESDSSRYGVSGVSSTTLATGLYEGLEFDADSPELQKTFNTVKFTCKPLPTGTSFSCRFKLNNSTTENDNGNPGGLGWEYAFLSDNGTTFSNVGQTEAIFNIKDKANIYEIGVDLNPSGSSSPEILSITTYIADNANQYG